MKVDQTKVTRAEAKAAQAEAEGTRLMALMKAEEAKVTRAKAKAARLTVLMKTVKNKETRARKKRSHDDPEHVGGSRPLNGMQVCQKLVTEHNVILKKVKLERDEATSKRDETK